MKTIFRWLGAVLAACLLLGVAVLGCFSLATTEWWAQQALSAESLTARQQTRIDEAVGELAAKHQVSGDVLAPYVENAASRYQQTLAAWWQELWRDPDAELMLPVYLSQEAERELIAAVMADETFAAATESASRRAVARDEVAYGVDEIVCDAVLPLRRSVVELGLSMAADRVSLHEITRYALIGAGVLAGAALVLLLLARKAAGSALLTASGLMTLVSIPVWLLDIHAMLWELNVIAAVQADSVLLWLAIPWYGAALLLAAVGCIIIRIRNERL